MKKNGVVRTLYGDILAKRREIGSPDFYQGLLREVKESTRLGEQSDLTCVWGRDNFRFCLKAGLRNVLCISEEPYGCPKRKQERVDYYKGLSPWGHNHFWHKWQSLRMGLEEFESVVSVDWDCKQIRPLTDEWWDRQKSYGVSFRASLVKQPNFSWAARWRRKESFINNGCTSEDVKLLPFCGCFWTNNKKLVERCIWFSERVFFWMPEQALARWLDETHGEKWIGIEAYRKLGYEPDFIKVDHQLKKPSIHSRIWRTDKRRRKR